MGAFHSIPKNALPDRGVFGDVWFANDTRELFFCIGDGGMIPMDKAGGSLLGLGLGPQGTPGTTGAPGRDLLLATKQGIVTVDFGGQTRGTSRAVVTVPAPWITAGSTVVLDVLASQSPDHSPDEVLAEGLIAYPSNLIPGVSFDIQVDAPNTTWGRYLVSFSGR